MIKRIILASIVLIALAVVGVSYVYNAQKDYLASRVLNKQALLYEIPPGRSLSRVLTSLKDKQIIKASWQQRWLARSLRFIAPQLTKLKAGTYEIQPQISIQELLLLFTQGQEHQFSIRLAEGETFEQWLVTLKDTAHITHDLEGKSEAEIARLLGCKREKLEGLLLPETYHFTKGSSDLSLLQRAYKAMQTQLTQMWEERDVSPEIKTPYEALILASIIEKETAQSNERTRVASVFINRLKKGMRLQTDPTVIYGMGERYNGNITRKDLKQETAYNTYVIKGLPPTPIAMPGRESIYAALHPEETRYYYFVANGEGGHTFSRTLNQHNRAVKEYLRTLRKKKK